MPVLCHWPHCSCCVQIGVLHWFARLWEIDQGDYWGYITNCGTEGNLHGILVGRENLPDGILYASRETHYSVFKAARMYRMDAVQVIHPPCHFCMHWLKGLMQAALGCIAGSILQVQPCACTLHCVLGHQQFTVAG